eukprot:m.209400 g.209400  ORF g.209400 m.209400 type:complete len:59 (+) comp17140_c1_seq4:12-188(+)
MAHIEHRGQTDGVETVDVDVDKPSSQDTEMTLNLVRRGNGGLQEHCSHLNTTAWPVTS